VPFQAILSTLIETHQPAARAAIFCDDEGERVDSFALPEIEQFDIALLGAAYAPVARSVPPGSCLRVVHPEKTVWVATVEGGYYLVVLCDPLRDGGVRLDLPRAVAALAAHM
jgi:hypothetical protein